MENPLMHSHLPQGVPHGMPHGMPQGEGLDDVIQLNVPAAYRYLNVVAASIDALFERTGEIAGKEMLIYQVKLAVHEACTNIIDHAYGFRGQEDRVESWARIEINLSILNASHWLAVDIYDTGKRFDLPDIRKPREDEVQTHGYGLFLIYELMDEVHYEALPGKNHWQLVKYLPVDQ